MIEVNELLNACTICRWIFRRADCESCHYNFLKPFSPLPPSNNEGPLKAVKMRVLPRGWVIEHGLERVCAFIVYHNKDLNSTTITCCRSYGSMIQVEVQFWKAKTLVHAMSFDDFQTANKYALEYMRDLTDNNDDARFRGSLEDFMHT